MAKNKLVRLLIAPLASAIMMAGLAAAEVEMTGSISGNTVNYSVQGLAADTDYVVTIQHLGPGGQGSMHGNSSNAEGLMTGSGTPGESAIEPGDTVRVRVTQDGQTVASRDFTKDLPPPAPISRVKKKRWYNHPAWPWNW